MNSNYAANDSRIKRDWRLPSPSQFKEIGPSGLYSETWVRNFRLPSANIQDMLKERELGGRKRTPQHKLNTDIITSLAMSRASVTEMNGKDYIISWTTDGCRLICVSPQVNSVKVYRYLGIQNSRNEIWDHKVVSNLFEIEFQINPQLAYGCSILLDTIYFTSCGRFFLFAATKNAPIPPGYRSVNQNNESLSLPANVEDMTLYCVDIQGQIIADEKTFYMDKIILNTCISISGHILVVTSPIDQVIFVIRIHPETGEFIPLKEIGPAVRDSEEVYRQTQAERAQGVVNHFYPGLKQRIMIFLYNRAREEGRVMEMLRSTAYYESLRIYSTYVFEKWYILIRMLPKDWNMKTTASPCFFMVLDWREATILEIFEDFDKNFQNFTDKMRLSLTFPLTSSAWVGAANYPKHADRLLGYEDKCRSKLDCQADIAKRVLNQLPFGGHTQYKISLQSPYLDSNNFQIPNKIFQGIFSGKLRTDQDDPRFMVTRTKKASFQLSLSGLAHFGIHIASVLFHPQDPLCIVIDRTRMSTTTVIFQPGLQRERELTTLMDDIKSPTTPVGSPEEIINLME